METDKNNPKLLSLFWMFGWGLLYSTSMALIKKIGPEVPTIIKIFMRIFFGMMFFMPIAVRQGITQLKTTRLPLHLLRACLTLGAMFCTYHAYARLPLAFATSIGFTGPLITTLLSIFFLNERVAGARWLALFTGYAGVLIMIRPGIGGFDPATWVALFANLLASLTVITMKIMTRTEPSVRIIFYANTILVTATGIIAFFNWKSPDFTQLVLLFFLGGTGVFSQLCYVKAYKYSQPSFLAPLEYLRLVFAVPIGIYFFDEYPDLWTLAGVLVIISSTFFMTISESREMAASNNKQIKSAR